MATTPKTPAAKKVAAKKAPVKKTPAVKRTGPTSIWISTRALVLGVIATLGLTACLMLVETKTNMISHFFIPPLPSLELPQTQLLQLHDASKDKVRQFAKLHPEVAAVAVMAINLQENRREAQFRVINDGELTEAIKTQGDKYDVPLPVFSSNEQQNTEMRSLLAGEFRCTSSHGGAYSDRYKLDNILTTSCRVPIPPYYGKLAGYIAFHMRTAPTAQQLDQLRVETLKLSVDIYNNEALSMNETAKRNAAIKLPY